MVRLTPQLQSQASHYGSLIFLGPCLALTPKILPFSTELRANSVASAETLMTSRVIDVELEFIMSDFYFSFPIRFAPLTE